MEEMTMTYVICTLAGVIIGIPLGAILMLHIGLRITDERFEVARSEYRQFDKP
jgi:hypothetical protein